ncbi:MAG: hypothetical protein A2W91_04060 [Bacteroidetes bacterium GWF2_38_335]|nr:MAG: hypothetical protein A2W91_04060 [Bacteroidetes bacterium GWF2_38_335]OFY79125.1 MAG: hypothetical protein A2281_03395 [Bacteroidetes bacterium RIFOXYA12_FULL_38_20]HBS88788.1 hypothetical protein [Bacteroidales bacterium]
MVDIKFKGEFRFSDKESLKDALSEVKEFINEEDISIRKIWKESHEITGLSVVIDINCGCAQDDFWGYEGIIETLAESAIEGKVEGWRDDYPEGETEIYEAEGDSGDEKE